MVTENSFTASEDIFKRKLVEDCSWGYMKMEE